MGIQLRRNIDEPGRNDPCFCGSGLKYKHCHADPMKKAMCNAAANAMMAQLILGEQIKKGLRCKHNVLKTEHCKECKLGD